MVLSGEFLFSPGLCSIAPAFQHWWGFLGLLMECVSNGLPDFSPSAKAWGVTGLGVRRPHSHVAPSLTCCVLGALSPPLSCTPSAVKWDKEGSKVWCPPAQIFCACEFLMSLMDTGPELETQCQTESVSKHLLSIFTYSHVLRSAMGREGMEAQGTIRCYITMQSPSQTKI